MTKLVKKQVIERAKQYREDGHTYRIKVRIRHDDQCGNGHNTFSITGDIDEQLRNGRWREYSGGCIHDEIANHFPELQPFIKWHLTSTDGPMHYVANTTYLAGDTDYNGLREGEKRQLRNGRTGLPVWEAVVLDGNGEARTVPGFSWFDAETAPEADGDIQWRPVWIEGEGKEPELEAARRTAIWPDATLEQLRDKKALEARLPALMKEFRAAVESLGLVY
jgi:uncharacterized protein Usg